MGRPLGSRNKTPAELKVDADMLKKKAELQELAKKKKVLEAQRKVQKNGQ